MNAYERCMATLRGEPRDHVPCQPLLMTFAARYAGAPYREYVTDSRVLVRAQLHAAEAFGVGSVTCCSDAWREASDCGAKVVFFDDAPPACKEHLLADKSGFTALRMPDPATSPRMSDRVAAVAGFAERVKGELPITGWVEGPVAQASDLRGINELMMDTLDDLPFVLDLFEWVTELEIAFARAQVRAGADIIGVGDAAASLVSREFYEAHALPSETRIVDAIHDAGALVRLHVCGNASHLLGSFGRLGCDIVELDYPVDLARARAEIGPEPALLGNIDPVSVVRNGTPEAIVRGCAACADAVGPRHIVGAGCEIPPDTPHENLLALSTFARETP